MQFKGMVIKVANQFKLIKLDEGNHSSPEFGMCVMEATCLLYPGEKRFTDFPNCVSYGIAGFAQGVNDSLGENDRQFLWKYIPKFIGTAHDGMDNQRAKAVCKWLMKHDRSRIESILNDIEADWDYGPEGKTARKSFEEDLDSVMDMLSGAWLGQDRNKRIKKYQEILDILMPHEPPSLAKLQWEKLLEGNAEDISLSDKQFAQYMQHGMAVTI